MQIPDDLRFAETHEWLRLEGDVAAVGISDHAQAELTDVVYVEPPQLGANVQAKQAVAVVESVKAASDIYSPASGEVVEVNEELQSAPGLINTDPYGRGWIFKLRLSNPDELSQLKEAAAYRQQIG